MRLALPRRELSATLESICAIERIEIRHNGRHLMEAEFDQGRAGRRYDLRPRLPLVITC